MTTSQLKTEIAATIRLYNTKGWSPATSTNYSFRDEENTIWVSRSGVDKSQFSENDFITVDENGLSTGHYITIKPSAETLIHCTIYQLFPETKVIFHSHGVYPILLSMETQNTVNFEGYEVQKGFAGQTTHVAKVDIRVFDNTQDMEAFSATLKNNLASIKHHSFIMRKHGTYAWGNNLFDAKRHLETLDYLCECEWRKKSS
ncbi:MAG: methylthioribulose 1-phosphate dehydratase [Bacteroidota bacterium]